MKHLIIIVLILFSIQSVALVEGDLNPDFGSNGSIEFGQDNWDYYSSGFAISPFNNFEYYHAYVKRNKDDINDSHSIILEHQSQLMPTSVGVATVDPSMARQKVGLVVDSNGGVFIAYSYMDCNIQGDMCEQDITVSHYSSNGFLIDSEDINFDLGSTYLRQNDKFIDMIYMPEVNRLALAVDVDRSGVFDNDFGIAVIDVSQFGDLTLSSNFSLDGIASCYFDQNGSGGSLDNAKAITYEKSMPYNIIVGGSVFEGNGTNNDGWNLGFCEFNQSGVEIRKWSTQVLSDLNDDREFLQGMKFSSVGGKSLIVAASVGGLGGLDFAITKYIWDANNNVWNIDANFGDTSIFAYRQGWNTKGFEELFIGQTNDNAKQMYIETDGSILVAGDSSWIDNLVQYSRIQLVKFNPSGIIDSSWGYSGSISHALTNTLSEEVMVLTESADNKEIFLTGTHILGDRSTAYIANLINTDVIFKSSFEY